VEDEMVSMSGISGFILEKDDDRGRYITCIAFGSADAKIVIKAAGDLDDFATLEGGANIHGRGRTI
jgi:hypothetical protein